MIGERMKTAGKSGAIVNVSSIAATHAFKGLTTYCASKGAVNMITRCMAMELGPHKIRVNCVNPGMVLTPLVNSGPDPEALASEMIQATPMNRLATPEEVADAILYLLSDQASVINGIQLPVDGGITVR